MSSLPLDSAPVRLVVSGDPNVLDVVSSELFDAGASGLVEEHESLVVYPQSIEERARFEACLAALGARFPSLRVATEAVSDEWQDSWQRELGPESISPSFLLVPTHHRLEENPSKSVLWFRPRASFGDGEHATTRLAAAWLETWMTKRPQLDCFDVGTGTGVLAMVAAKLGATSVLAVDNDPVAVESARDNVALNDLGAVIEVRQGSADASERHYDLVIANINTPILLELAPSLAARVGPQGVLTLTGLLTEDAAEVQSALAPWGLSVFEREESGDWALLAFRPTRGRSRPAT